MPQMRRKHVKTAKTDCNAVPVFSKTWALEVLQKQCKELNARVTCSDDHVPYIQYSIMTCSEYI